MHAWHPFRSRRKAERLVLSMSLAWIAAIILAANPTIASDGILEINQVCAEQTGCFSGDAPGFPVTIDGSAGQSYRLTGDLTILDPSDDGLSIEAPRVTIDLNGFQIFGFGLGAGPGQGITGSGTNGSDARLATISNGSIRGHRGKGISLSGADGVRVSEVAFESNTDGAVSLGDEAQIADCRFTGNGSNGSSTIEVGDASRVEGNTVAGGGGTAIDASDASVVRRNTILGHAQNGVRTASGAVVSENSIRSNTLAGVTCSSCRIVGNTLEQNQNGVSSIGGGALIEGNIITTNHSSGISGNELIVRNNVIRANASHGVTVGNTSILEGNQISFNNGFGINAASGAPVALRNNALWNNTAGTVSGGLDLGGNVCQGAASCP